MRYEKLVTHVQPHASAMSLLESGIALYKSDQQQQQINTDEVVFCMCVHMFKQKKEREEKATTENQPNLTASSEPSPGATCPQTGVSRPYATGNRSALKMQAYDQGV